MSGYFAHSENSAGIKHDLVEHLKSVAQMVAEFAAWFWRAQEGKQAGWCSRAWAVYPAAQGTDSGEVTDPGKGAGALEEALVGSDVWTV